METLQHSALALADFLRRQWRINAPLTLFSLVMAGFTLVTLVALAVDDRVIVGQPAWLKPVKFGISLFTYGLSTTWMLGFVRSERPWVQKAVRAFTWIVIAVAILEILPITVQVIRGTRSHFNYQTPFDVAVVAVMGVSITVFWVANFVLAGILFLQRFENPALGWSIRWGLIIAIIGMGLGYVMTAPTADQIASWEAGAPVTVVGAHSVGVPDGGPGMPVTGWSVEGGDMRIPHFVGLHGLQVVPWIGLFIASRRRLSLKQQVILVWIAALGFLGLLAIVTWQALRGQPLVAPDGRTLGALGALLSSVVLAVAATLRKGLRDAREIHAVGALSEGM